MTIQQLHDKLAALIRDGFENSKVYADVPEDPEGWRKLEDSSGWRGHAFVITIAEDTTDPSFL